MAMLPFLPAGGATRIIMLLQERAVTAARERNLKISKYLCTVLVVYNK